MPYTPPSQRSPANSKPNSPVLSRAHSYAEEKKPGLPHSHSFQQINNHAFPQRPALPRSLSSTAYLQRHRRTPSISDNANKSEASGSRGSNTSGSVRQSPQPVNNSLVPSGAITTPPDSTNNSSDEDDRGRRRLQFTGELAQLAQALQQIEVKRESSPAGGSNRTVESSALSASFDLASPGLTPEARKIAHSRSASELTLSTHNTALSDSPIQTSDDSDGDDGLVVKPPLLRKKSGELVKPALRPSSRRRPSSMPGTPTFSKVVHFNENMEQVRHFLQVDRPIAVSAGSSPVSEMYDSDTEYPFGSNDASSIKTAEWDIKLANFPKEDPERETEPLRVERIFLSSDHKTLIGTVAVANLAFNKHVTARFTLDYWKTISEVVAEFNNDVRKKSTDSYDRFNFYIKLSDLANLEAKTLLLCVRYQVNGQEYWDNNRNMNFQVDFVKRSRSKNRSSGQSSGGLGAVPRSRQAQSGAGRPRSYPSSFDEDFTNGFGSRYEFGNGDKNTDDTPQPTIRLKKSSRKGSVFPNQASLRQNAAGSPFATRYDFGASLTAALSTAQSAMTERKPLVRRESQQENAPGVEYNDMEPGAVSPSEPASAPTQGPNPTSITSEKPALQSAEYNELIQKYCFFGSGKSSPQMASPQTNPPRPAATDGVRDSDSDTSPPGSLPNSGSNTPSPSQGMSPALDGANDQQPETHSAPKVLSRSNSPGAFGSRTASPVSFGYPYHQSNMGGIFPESHTPTAIRG